MDANFFSGSENLYKYLVSIGILLIVMTVYYPLKEKQRLEILKIELTGEVEVLNYKIKENQKSVQSLQAHIGRNGADSKEVELLEKLEQLNYENHISDIKCSQKFLEIKARQNHIRLYNLLFWIFLPLGITITTVGFLYWYNIKRTEDEIVKENLKKIQSENNGESRC